MFPVIKIQRLLLVVCLLSSLSCSRHFTHSNRIIIVQPFGSFPASKSLFVCKALRQVNSNTFLRAAIPLPSAAYYPARKRYRADSLLHYLDRAASADTVIIGLTDQDISTGKNAIADWGVMGLGNCPGNACIVSTFRLSTKNGTGQLYKFAVHELEHTQGLPHCSNPSCFMRDATGGNHLDEETGFCAPCKAFLIEKGWHL